MTDSTPRASALAVPRRRRINRDLAHALVFANIPVFPSSGKVPLIPKWQQLDTDLSPSTIDEALMMFQKEYGHAAAHIGATRAKHVVDRLWKLFPDAVPSISCGPANLVVIDADAKHDGPAKLMAWLSNEGVSLDGVPITETQSGGLHVFFRNDGTITSSGAGKLKALGCDVRAVGGQVVAPGSIRDDCRIYKSKPGTPSLIEALAMGLPELPAALRTAIGSEHHTVQSLTGICLGKVAPDFEALIDPILGLFDPEAYCGQSPTWARLWRYDPDADAPHDHSAARLSVAAQILKASNGAASVDEYAAFLENMPAAGIRVEGQPGPGEYNSRNIERDWLKAKASYEAVPKASDGRAFGIVVDIDDEAPSSALKLRRRKSFADFIGEFEPPNFVLDGLAQDGSIYTLTAKTGAGKTVLLTAIALAVAAGRNDLLGFDVQPGRVAYFSFENPSDFRLKLMAAAESYQTSANEIGANLDIVDARMTPLEMRRELKGEKWTLIILDTLAAALGGLDPNDNAVTGEFVRALRPLAKLDGKPCVIIAAHPIKNAGKENLIPYGGGAILNEVDGNFTLWRDEAGLIVLHWQGKHRGLEFEPIQYAITASPFEGIKDGKGRAMTLPIISRVSERVAEQRSRERVRIHVDLLRAMKANETGSLRDWAKATASNHPRVRRLLEALQGDKLVSELAGKWSLTKRGLSVLDENLKDDRPEYAVIDDE